ncbi:MAG: UbiA family prenyltransferase [Candidatus Moraniibacteriota bacterium]
MQERLRSIFEDIENRPLTLGAWAVALFSIIIIRIGIENYLESLPFRFADQFFYQFSHHFLTFTTIFLAALPIIAWAGRVDIRKATNVLLTGFLVIWTPPIVDEIISRGTGLWSFYSFDSLMGLLERYVTFFGDKPDVGITYGVRFEVGIVVLLIFVYTWIKSHSIIRTIVASLGLYTVLFIIGVLPSIITILLYGPSAGFFAVTEHDIARLMLSPAPLFVLNPPDITSVLAIKMSLMYGTLIVPLIAVLIFSFFRPTFWSLFRNARFPQLFYHGGLFLVGAALTLLYGETSGRLDIFHIAGAFILLAAVECAWLASIVVNDLRDVAIDRLTNTHRPLVTGTIDAPTYKIIGLLFFGASLFLSAIISTQVTLLLVVYQALAFLYSADPLRLKRYPVIASALAAMASLLILFAGFIVFSTEKNIAALPISISLLLFFAYLAIIPIKDFKDIVSDQADSVLTLPVILGEAWAKRSIGAFVFMTFVASPFVLSVRSLFPLGLFFGALAFWILQLSLAEHRYLSYRKLPAWFVLLAIGYGSFLALALSK